MIDLTPATQRMTTLINAIPEDQLAAPTPCEDTTIGDLLDHVGGLSLAFTAAADKQTGLPGLDAPPPKRSAANLAPDWRTTIPQQLAALAEAWKDPSAWTGMTKAGGIDLPGEIAGLVALDEVVVHGWDIARASGQPYEPDPSVVEAAMEFVQPISQSEEPPPGLFKKPVPVADDASALDKLIGLTGRDPTWSPPAT